ncbi:MAG: hypothetical protein AAF388_30005, partial [Bacteroidota bacterium]
MMLFKEVVPDEAVVKRERKWIRIDAEGLCVGDVIRVTSGERCPADLRVFQVEGEPNVRQHFFHQNVLRFYIKVDVSDITGDTDTKEVTSSTNDLLDKENATNI